MEQLGPLAGCGRGHGRPISSTGKVVERIWARRPHALAGRPDRGRRPARLARRGAPRSSPTASGSTRSPTTAAADGLDPRGRHGHGRLQPVPRGARPHLPAVGRPARAAGARHHRPGRGRPHRPRVPRRRARSSSPRRSRARTIETRSHLEHFWAAHRPARAVRGRHRPGLRRSAQLAAERRLPGHVREPRPTSAAATRRCRTSAWCRRRWPGVDWPALLGAADRHGRAPRLRRRPGRRTPGSGSARSSARRCRPAGTRSRSSSTSDIETFGLWLEQLLAESTGKQGTGRDPGRRRARSARPRSTATTGSSWASASTTASTPLAAAGHPVVELGVRRPARPRRPGARCGSSPPRCAARCSASTPSTSPNVAEAKEATGGGAGRRRACPTSPSSRSAPLLDQVGPGDYVAIQAYVDPESGVVDAHRGRPHRASATGSGWPPPSASAPASCTPPASCTRAGRRPACSSRWSATTPTDVAIPGAPFTFSHAEAGAGRRRPAAPCARHGLRAARVALDDLVEVTR